ACGVTYKLHVIAVRQHPEFKKWLDGLRDKAAQKKIAQRIVRLEAGLLGMPNSSMGSVNSASTSGRATGSISCRPALKSSSCFAEGPRSTKTSTEPGNWPRRFNG